MIAKSEKKLSSQVIAQENRATLAVLHDLGETISHPKGKRLKVVNGGPSLGNGHNKFLFRLLHKLKVQIGTKGKLADFRGRIKI